ncbi:hypothetical protein H4R34_002792 [Dimargaris verticillata]|uniref:Uncharacterized protein n=1 Tax=Dimargaris verticillata TaxID=2761393 RepID=A0A9W8B243_9FUNG|nr:hypothetical protein H4R34_002792 [Dimargaris verticillata]
MSNLDQILARLRVENLLHARPPTPPHTLPRRQMARSDSGVAVDLKEPDPDARDPRWFDLFVEYFLENSDGHNDDLLFFIRQVPPEMDGKVDPVFVKRKMPPPNRMPVIDDLVQWKETFFLNLIVQLPCTLTMAVCKRNIDRESLLERQTNISMAHDPMDTAASSNSVTPESLSYPDLPSQRDVLEKSSATSMTCSWKHVSKRVYALPSKQRVNVKDAHWECSYPYIYYVIDDYEDMFEQLIITEDEYLCVELAVTLPNSSGAGGDTFDGGAHSGKRMSMQSYATRDDMPLSPPPQVYYNDPRQDPWFQVPLDSEPPTSPMLSPRSSIHIMYPEKWSEPFRPLPRTTKITLFQAAVSYQALLDMYTTRSNSYLWRKLRLTSAPAGATEYIKMRGPRGKGLAQVAVSLSDVLRDQLPRPGADRGLAGLGGQEIGKANGLSRSKTARAPKDPLSRSLQAPKPTPPPARRSLGSAFAAGLKKPKSASSTHSHKRPTHSAKEGERTSTHGPSDFVPLTSSSTPSSRSKTRRPFASAMNNRLFGSTSFPVTRTPPLPTNQESDLSQPMAPLLPAAAISPSSWPAKSRSPILAPTKGLIDPPTVTTTATITEPLVHPSSKFQLPRSIPLTSLLYKRRSEEPMSRIAGGPGSTSPNTVHTSASHGNFTALASSQLASSRGTPKAPTGSPTPVSLLQTFRKLTLSSLTDNLRSLRNPSSAGTSSNNTPAASIKCSLTFVGVHWASIINDLQDYAHKKL